jgi:hypothetical protein
MREAKETPLRDGRWRITTQIGMWLVSTVKLPSVCDPPYETMVFHDHHGWRDWLCERTHYSGQARTIHEQVCDYVETWGEHPDMEAGYYELTVHAEETEPESNAH